MNKTASLLDFSVKMPVYTSLLIPDVHDGFLAKPRLYFQEIFLRKAPFRKYALLSNDIVIADRAVAEKSQALLDILDVSISESKSIDSKTGALEFAKQFWIDKVSINLTPVSAKAILASGSLIGLCQLAEKYNLSRSCLSRLTSAGYRVRGRILSSRLSRRWKRLQVVSDRSLSDYRLPLDLWLGRGNHLKGIMIDRVRLKYKPKQS